MIYIAVRLVGGKALNCIAIVSPDRRIVSHGH